MPEKKSFDNHGNLALGAITHRHREEGKGEHTKKPLRAIPIRIGKRGIAKEREKKNRLRKEKELALGQIFLLLISVVAFSYAVGSEVEFVSGALENGVITNDQNQEYIFSDDPYTYRFYNDQWQTKEGPNNLNEWAAVSPKASDILDDRLGIISVGGTQEIADDFLNAESGTIISTTGGAPVNPFGGGTYLEPDINARLKIFGDAESVGLPRPELTQIEGGYYYGEFNDGSRRLYDSSGILISIGDANNPPRFPSGEIVTPDIVAGGTSVITEGGLEGGAPGGDFDGYIRDTKTIGETTYNWDGKHWVPEGGGTLLTDAQMTSTLNTIRVSGLIGRHVTYTDPSGATTSGILKLNPDKTYGLYGSDGKVCGSHCGNAASPGLTIEQAVGTQGSFNWGQFGSGILKSLSYAVLIYSAIQLFGPVLGLESEETNALSGGVALGYLIGSTINLAGKSAPLDGFAAGWQSYGTGIGIGVAVFYILNKYRKEELRVVQFSCNPWQSPARGEDCEECNTQGLPCSEYQCKALGQGCELVNVGTTEEVCVWVNRKDVNPPIMNPWEDALLNNYSYTPNNAISPPDRGVIVEQSNGNCAPAFTPLQFGVVLDEPAKCKIDTLRKPSFEEMDLFISEGLLKYNHSFALTLPGSSNLNGEGIEVENDGNYEVYVRCEDANGNFNLGNFVFKYCVDKGPDTTPPLVVQTNIPNGMPISFNQSEINVEFYINEPAECKWSHNDRDYTNMEEDMDCNLHVLNPNAQGLYTCGTTLNGLKNKVNNEFFIRCKDQPIGVEDNSRNINVQSYKYILKGTQPLVIDSFSPDNETIKDSTDPVKVTFEVETSAGFNDGESICSFRNDLDDDWIEFLNTNSHEHSQVIYRPEGSYTWYIQCMDLGGNVDSKTLNFDVDSDNEAPLVVRAYHEETYLKLTTLEAARCVYDVVDCSYNFDDGVKITSADDFNHFVDWDIESDLHIKCKDEFDNEPLPNQCSIIVRSTDF